MRGRTGVDGDRHPHREARRGTAGRGGCAVDRRTNPPDTERRCQVEHDLIGVLRGQANHARSKRPQRNSRIGRRTAQPESAAVDVTAAVFDPRTGKYRPQAFDGFAHDRHVVRPRSAMPAGHDRRTGSSQREVNPTAGERSDRTDP
ncbi:Uncharacterised protein [Mycobacterium tuberculosis]|nr:Uncharacterised protein [Mycobacterium tuberculosis]